MEEAAVPTSTDSVAPYQVGPTVEDNAVIQAYKQQIKDLQNKLDAASYRLGYLEHERETHLTQIKLLTDSQHQPSWWRRAWHWFIGKS